ncbi:hypothetical protein TVAG_351370 [Trichomonas vaginalis G3]|uniref:UDENN domain-containing protein n=1 Tax=Trichomonas vaginalis (strain ATCC PRA-98 / G3) TaxID=412133 RepID=A2DZM1_TRIV3|nr:Rab guanyl-nucleotide exchange factor protein [Trichomonas vaginalis G3]EAY14089.1 hypothetical protein TVAG_351370 [Trichomonas vaginalis G3]KAI5525099.1 Rab guanyl-nucleotide exchange factor protein [Trichomonas vaginalis G3]|eukprot:XP_001326312.1 hypothetical protein [Trichomonas vaginalis G3]
MFDQFLLVGIPPTGTPNDKPAVLAAFPPCEISGLPFGVLIDYALPNGTKPEKQPVCEKLISDMFVFTINSCQHRFYGSTLILNPTQPPLPFYVSEFTKNTLFAFVIISRNEYISSHLTFLSFLALFSAGKIPNPNILSPRLRPEHHPSDQNEGFKITNYMAHHPDMPLLMFFSDQIHAYCKYAIESEPLQLAPNFAISIPKEQCEFLNCAIFDTFFSSLTIENIISLVTALLLDRQIVVFGSNFQQVSLVVLSLLQLIHPVNYVGTAIPALPNSSNYLTLLEAPTPFIIGCKTCDQLTNIEFDETAVFVNMDARQIEFVTPLPNYPSSESILRKLKRLVSNSARSKLHSLSFPFFYRSSLRQNLVFSKSTVSEISNIFRKPLSCLYTEEVYPYFISDINQQHVTTEFNKEIFLSMREPEERTFFEELFNSQSFNTYIQDVLSKYAEERGQSVSSKKRRPLMRRQSSRKISIDFLHL